MRKIGGVFGRSPFGPAHEHLLKVIECLEVLGPLVDAAARGEMQATAAAADDIRRLETEADEIKRAIRMQMTTSIFASVSRSEVMALTKAQDDVADECYKVAFELSVRKTEFPDFLTEDAGMLVEKITVSAKPLAEVSRRLDQSQGRLSGKDSEALRELLEKARASVEAVEPVYDKLLRDLFKREDALRPLDVIFIMRFAEYADRVAKKVENVIDVLTRLVTETAA